MRIQVVPVLMPGNEKRTDMNHNPVDIKIKLLFITDKIK